MLVWSAFIIILDQITKYYATRYLKGMDAKSIIGNFFQLSYVENRGAAFGILQDKKFFFIIITVIVVSVLIWTMKKYAYKMNIFFKFSMVMLLGGTIGNFIDRLRQGYVVDFLSFNFGNYSFPVFNIADICIVLGTILLMGIITLDKDDIF